jgi:hypothetical protein
VKLKGVVLILFLAAVLTAASTAPAGGIDDQPCPNVAGENTNTCPAGTVGTPYVVRFVEREGSGCGPGRQTFHLDSGLVPPGLALDKDGTLSGTPERVGRFRFYVEMREPLDDPEHCAGKETQKQFTLPIRNPVSILTDPAVTLVAEVGAPFRTTLRAAGGTGVFRWTTLEGELPAGVSLGRSGSIAGTPLTAGTYHFTARASDTEKRSATWSGTLRVAPRLRIRTERVRTARVGRSYDVALRTTGGVGPKRWRLRDGALPRGVRLATALGRLAGTPQEAGRYRVSIEVVDALGVKSAKTLTVVVSAATHGASGAENKHQ